MILGMQILTVSSTSSVCTGILVVTYNRTPIVQVWAVYPHPDPDPNFLVKADPDLSLKMNANQVRNI
jgi:hypothetical protein